MANILDYLTWRGDLSFRQDSFNIVDNLIFSQICYIDFLAAFKNENKIKLNKAAKLIFESTPKEKMVLGLFVPAQIVTLFYQSKDTKRFGNVYVSDYQNVLDENLICQFSAICFHITNNLIYVAFRGTDDTLIGWQENINMINVFMVEAQKKATSYLDEIAIKFPKSRLIVGGHSKGGNLATCAAIYCSLETKKRIVHVYSNDGPGFIKENIDIKKYKEIKNKIIRIIPYGSVIGQLFTAFACKNIVVSSNQKGIMQHDGFSWQVQQKDFVKCDDVSIKSLKVKEKIDSLLLKLTNQDKIDLAADVYKLILKTHEKTLLEISKKSIKVLANLNRLSFKNKKILFKLLIILIKYK